MTARLSPLQRQVLEQLAHIRVAPEDAWMTTERLARLVNLVNPVFRPVADTENMGGVLRRLRDRELVAYDHGVRAWRITDKGREAL